MRHYFFLLFSLVFTLNVTSVMAEETLRSTDVKIESLTQPVGGYAVTMRLTNTSTETITIKAHADGFSKAVFRIPHTENGKTNFVEESTLSIPGGGSRLFTSAGLHIHLSVPHHPLKVGDWVKIILQPSKGNRLIAANAISPPEALFKRAPMPKQRPSGGGGHGGH